MSAFVPSIVSKPQMRMAAAIDAAIALGCALAFLAFHALRGFPSLADSGGDNDSLLRLVQVRDLLSGQGWFDPTQYRMGLEGGFAMHWSRLIDLPLAVLVTAFGERVAIVIWPMLLFALCLFLILRVTRRIGGETAVLPAVVVGGLALFFINIFQPGALDHHNAQLALALAALHALVVARPGEPAATLWGALAGAYAALMLAIGMEAAPYAGAACAVAATCFLLGGERDARLARGFGLAFAGVSAAALVATTPAHGWLAVQCDALSLPQTSLALLGGGGLALLASIKALAAGPLWGRLIALAVLGGVAATVAIAAFPHCLGDPYADVDPVLRTYWLNAVTEARSLMDIVLTDIPTLAGYYVTPLIALCVVSWTAARRGLSREIAIIGAFLAIAVVVSVWQVRGGMFSVPFAAIVLAAWIGQTRSHALAQGGAGRQLAMAASWLISIALLWHAAASNLAAAPAAGQGTEKAGEPASACYDLAAYATLAALPQGTVLTISNLGASVLHQTSHRVLNGPYHRNNAGNRAALDILMGDPADAEEAARALDIFYVALCRGNPETAAIRAWSPDGFLAGLVAGGVPAWLQPISQPQGKALEVFAVLPE